MATKHFSVQTVGWQSEAVLWLINIETNLKKAKTGTICHMHILTYRTERQSINMDKNQRRYQWNNSNLDDILKRRK
jgi:hypothetical protein